MNKKTMKDDELLEELGEAQMKESLPVPLLRNPLIDPEYFRGLFREACEKVSRMTSEIAENPEKDFTRKQVFTFEELVRFLVLMGGGGVLEELSTYFSMDTTTVPPHGSTLCMARKKLKPQALYLVFRYITDHCSVLNDFKGYRLVGVDGSGIKLPLNRKETETLHQDKENKPYSQCYFHGAYDLLNCIYLDAVISASVRKTDERTALLEMADSRHLSTNTIFVGDRGYGGWKIFATLLEKQRHFVLREKDKDRLGIFKSLNLSEDEGFDIVRTVILTNKQTKMVKAHPELYRTIMTNQDFPYLDKDNEYYVMTLRFTSIKVAEGKYICLVTDFLDKEEITVEDLKYIYYLRWGIEGSYRIFKYTCGVIHFHARSFRNCLQEIYARMTQFNISQLIAGCVAVDGSTCRVLTQEEYRKACMTPGAEEEPEEIKEDSVSGPESSKKYRYKPNLSAAITNIKQFLKGMGTEAALIARIKRYLIPVRPGRSFPRNIRIQPATSLLYRCS